MATLPDQESLPFVPVVPFKYWKSAIMDEFVSLKMGSVYP